MQPFAKAFQTIETCALVNNNLYGKLFSLLKLPAIFDKIFKIISAPSFIPAFNLLSCELDHSTFTMLY